jgi:hypothetical protein
VIITFAECCLNDALKGKRSWCPVDRGALRIWMLHSEGQDNIAGFCFKEPLHSSTDDHLKRMSYG